MCAGFVFIATPHRGSYLTEYPVTEFLGRFLTLPLRIVRTGVELARNAGDFKVNPSNLGSGSLFGMTPNNPVLQTMAATPIAPDVHAHSIIAVCGNGPVEGSDDGVVEYSSSHLDGVDSEYILSVPLTRPSRTLTRSRRCGAFCCFTLSRSARGSPAATRCSHLVPGRRR